MLLKHASASIDTSDGFFAAVDQLMRVNGVGFTITTRADEYIADRALGLCDSARLPRWFMLAGPHGEYELVFTLHPENETAFLQEAGASAWHPVKLGAAVKECCISFLYDSRQRRVDTGAIRNIFARTDRGIDEYVKELSSIEQSWRRA
jgi:thiamine-monophosphate kinase